MIYFLFFVDFAIEKKTGLHQTGPLLQRIINVPSSGTSNVRL